MIGKALALAFLLQTPVDPTVAVVLRDEVVIMRLSEARVRYGTVDPVKERALHVALTLALGTLPDNRIHESELTPEERQRFRWHRRPLQGR